ncbi:hypothetical protein TNCT_404331 [Trichonephila clavata]|uniref:Uncharacterized protein n=1 Tax=Trichonephila clavata TaxID=2740835 RepID=A0A8X6JWU2_TRICU|nr:hypothetical protein TNCT_404331 [Trichonephila clavata]
MDLLRHFKTQWILCKQGTPRTLSKSPYTKAGPLLGSQCPDLISRGTFRAIPATVPFIIQQSCVLMSRQQRTFQDNNACLIPGHNGMVFHSACLLLNKQCLNLSMDSGYLRRRNASTQQNSGLKLSMNILRTLTSNTGFHTTSGPETSWASVYLGTIQRKVLFYPLSRTVDFVFNVQHTPCLFDYKACFKPVNGPPKISRRNGSLNKETARTLIRKVLILKQAHQDHSAQ